VLKKTITFNDLDGNPVTEDFYFHLNKAEIAELQYGMEGGLSAHLREIANSGNPGLLLSTFKGLILKTVGRRSEDGRRFVKNQEITDDFAQTDAYASMFMELCTNANAAAEFINSVVPADLLAEAQALEAQAASAQPRAIESYSRTEIVEMSDDDFMKIMRENAHNLPKAFLVEASYRKQTNTAIDIPLP
jgi:hypothetical protein